MNFQAFHVLRKLGYKPCAVCQFYAYAPEMDGPVTLVHHYHHPVCPVLQAAVRRGFTARPWYLSPPLAGRGIGFDPADSYEGVVPIAPATTVVSSGARVEEPRYPAAGVRRAGVMGAARGAKAAGAARAGAARAAGARAGDVVETGKGLAGSALGSGKGYATGKAVDQLRSWGVTDEQIKILVEATGKSPDALVAEGKEAILAKARDAANLAVSYAKAKVSEAAVAGMKELGFSEAEAQALAATGGSVEKLKALGKEKLSGLVSDLNVRLKKEGIDIVGKAASSIGLTDKELGAAVAAAGAAYDIYTSVSDALDAHPTYSRGEWSSDLFQGDASLAALSHSLDTLALQSDANRTAQAAKTSKIVGSIEKAVAIVPVYGWIAAGAIEVGFDILSAVGVFASSEDDNGDTYAREAEANVKRLWNQYGFVPPAFDSVAYSLASYARDATAFQLQLLDAAEVERPFKEVWKKVVEFADNQPLDKPHPAISDLRNKSWFPLQFSEWMGGALSPVMSNDIPKDHGWSEVRGLDFCAGCSTGVIPQGKDWGDGQYPYFGVDFRILPGQSRENLGLNSDSTGWKSDIKFAKPPMPPFAAPRSVEMQTLIRDRMAASIGMMLAAINHVGVEGPVQAAVQKGRELIAAHGFDPNWSAKDFRDVFFEAAVSAGHAYMKTLKATPIETPSSIVGIKAMTGMFR